MITKNLLVGYCKFPKNDDEENETGWADWLWKLEFTINKEGGLKVNNKYTAESLEGMYEPIIAAMRDLNQRVPLAGYFANNQLKNVSKKEKKEK